LDRSERSAGEDAARSARRTAAARWVGERESACEEVGDRWCSALSARVSPLPPRSSAAAKDDPVATARTALLEGVGAEVAASFPGITRLGGQIVAALYLSDTSGTAGRSMDELSAELGRSKSNVFANLRALEAAGIVVRTRASGSRHDRFALRGPYPDVIVGAYVARLR